MLSSPQVLQPVAHILPDVSMQLAAGAGRKWYGFSIVQNGLWREHGRAAQVKGTTRLPKSKHGDHKTATWAWECHTSW